MTLIICGGRNYTLTKRDYNFLDALAKKVNVTMVFEGGASGADSGGFMWAESRGIPHQTIKADWSLGEAAGPLRNQQMLEQALALGETTLVAFPGDKGTADMVRKAKRHNVHVIERIQ